MTDETNASIILHMMDKSEEEVTIRILWKRWGKISLSEMAEYLGISELSESRVRQINRRGALAALERKLKKTSWQIRQIKVLRERIRSVKE